MQCVTSDILKEVVGSGGKASQILCPKIGVVPLSLDLTFVPGIIPLKKL